MRQSTLTVMIGNHVDDECHMLAKINCRGSVVMRQALVSEVDANAGFLLVLKKQTLTMTVIYEILSPRVRRMVNE